MTCFSFCREIKEEMNTHITLMGKIFEEYFSFRKYSILLSRLIGEDTQNIDKAFKYMILMHDSGKSFTNFQGKCSFKGHEYISAYLAYILGENFSEILKETVSTAIALHHHTMIDRFQIIYKLPNPITFSPQCIDFFKKHGIVFPEKVFKNDVIMINNKLTEFFKKNYRLVYYFLYPLTIIDNIAGLIR
ncbi:MAG: CRISPR-associated endonuclease Cas3'', partial [Thermoprotei archaeon]